VTRREKAGIGVAGEGRRLRLAIDHGHFVAVAVEFIGGRDAHDSGAED
jgi:hypothetical protein